MNLDLKILVTAFVTWTCIVAAATWQVNLRYNENLRDTIESDEKAKDWKVPEAIAATERASTELAKLAGKINSFAEKEEENRNLEEKIRILNETVSKENAIIKEQALTIESLQKQIKDLESTYSDLQSVIIKESSSIQVFDQKLSIGLTSVYDGRAVLVINNSTKFIDVGGFYETTINALTFIVTLKKADPQTKTVELNLSLKKSGI